MSVFVCRQAVAAAGGFGLPDTKGHGQYNTDKFDEQYNDIDYDHGNWMK